MQAAHQKGILHRDLTPANVVLTAAGEPVLLDFGLARQQGNARLTGDGQVMGTPAYIAPELLSGEVGHDTPASDVFSLGVLLYVSLTGQMPFGRTLREALQQLLTLELVPPSAHRPGVHAALDAICRKALARQPAARYSSMTALAADLHAFLQPSAPVALPAEQASLASPSQRLAGSTRLASRSRKRLLLLAGGAAALVVSVLLAVLLRGKTADDGAPEPGPLVPESRVIGPNPTIATRPVPLTRVVLSRDGKLALVSGFNGELSLCDVDARKVVTRFTGHTDNVWTAALSSDGKTVVSGSQDSTVRFWDAKTGKQRAEFPTDGVVSGLCFSPDGKRLAATCWDAKLRIWDDSGKLRNTFSFPMALLDPAFSPDGSTILLGTFSDSLLLCKPETGKVLRTFKGSSRLSHTVAFSPDGNRCLSGSNDGVVRLWDVSTAKELSRFQAHTGEAQQVVFLRDGEHCLTVGEDKSIRLWKARTGMELAVGTGPRNRVRGVALAPDGATALTADYNGQLRSWRLPAFVNNLP